MAEEKRDYYEVLGVAKTATKDDIKVAYRKLAKEYHPDLNHSPEAPKRFEEIQEAYDVLYDDNKRKQYDQFGMAAFQQGGSTGAQGNPYQNSGFSSQGFGDVDLNDIFSSFFGGGARRSSSGPAKGNDTLYRVRLDFMDAVNGRHITIPITFDEPCPNCNGTGAETPDDIATCPYCGGSGYVATRQQTIFGVMESEGPCPHCHGTGRIIKKHCHVCGGSGYNRVHKDLDVNIPSGINNGQQIRVKGKGERGSSGGENGDLYVEVQVNPDKRFRRDGNDIHTDLSLSFVQCALGASVDSDTVYGPVSVEIPSGTQPEQVLKLRGRGIKDLRSGKPGDQYVHVHVTTPTELTATEKELLTQFQKEEDSKGGKWWHNPFRR